ncbi:MAG TPA: hypothetical protein VKP59_02025 [Candidatus Thermoplasmatota archaeon]|nr:hypothetical protein [Candidatus Thermoplasmatota archaeon]
MKDKHLDRWKEIIEQTEDLVSEWKDDKEESPYFNQICKSWENFIEKQKDEYDYHLRRVGSSTDKKKIK